MRLSAFVVTCLSILILCLVAGPVPAQSAPAVAEDAAPDIAAPPPADQLQPGVSFRLYRMAPPQRRLGVVAQDQLPHLHEVRPTIDYMTNEQFGPFADRFIVRVEGWLKIDRPGTYRFRLTSDDGCRLRLDGKVLIENDFERSAEPALYARVALEPGLHRLRIDMFENQADQALRLQWRLPQERGYAVVPAQALWVEKDLDLATADPGTPARLRGPALRPGAGLPLRTVHPAYTLEPARPAGFEPRVGAMAFLPDGRLALTSFHPKNNGVFREQSNGTLYILDNPTATDPAAMTVHTVTDRLHDPLGMTVHDGALYVLDRNEVSKWTDTDNDGYPDASETFASGWVSDNFHHFSFGLPYHDGYFYATLSTSIGITREERSSLRGRIIAANGPNPPYRGSVMKIDAKTGAVQYIAGGLRTPNGVSIGPEGIVIVPDNQGAWRPASGLYVAQEGRFFGHYNNTQATTVYFPDGGAPSVNADQPVTPPAVYLPQNEISNSPAQLVMIPQGQPFAGQMLMAEITLGGLRRVFLEQVDGVWQGAVFRHSHGFEAGPNRLAWGPDGCLYVGGMGQGSGNWGWDNRTHGLERLRPSGATAFEFEKVQADPRGLRVTFTRPVPEAELEDLEQWYVDAWTYEPTADYGGPKADHHYPKIERAEASADRRSVLLVMSGLKPNYVYFIRTDVESDAGERMWSPEAWYTLHRQRAQ